MKKIVYFILLFVLVACENTYEDLHWYSRPYYLTKSYPIRLDASAILTDVQVKPPANPDAVFKIVSNDKYVFVGEKMKGIHVFEKTDASHVKPLCFIECKYMKAFDVANNILYCNNFVDLLAVDVEDPLRAKVLQRVSGHFNKYSNSSLNMNNPAANIYEIGYKTIVLTGAETDTKPAPDFSEYDQLYGNIIVKEIPDSLQVDKPYVGFTNVEGSIFTFGNNSLVLCSYNSGMLNIVQSSISVSGYYGNPKDLRYKNSILYLFGSIGFVYWDYNNITTPNTTFRNWSNLLDVVSLKEPANSFVMLYNVTNMQGEFVGFNIISGEITGGNYTATSFQTLGATSLVTVNDTILALGNQLALYRFYLKDNIQTIEQIKLYSAISGACMLKDGNVLIIANKQGLLFYDISDLGNIKLIP